MRVKGQEGADWGRIVVEPGWHAVEVDKAEDFTSNKGKRSFSVNLKIIEGENEGGYVGLYAPWDTGFGEKKLATLLLATGLEAAFEKAFPGDVSLFDARVVKKMMEKLPGTKCRILVEEAKGDFPPNINKVIAYTSDPMKFDKNASKGKAAGKSKETAGVDAGAGEAAGGEEEDPSKDW